MTTIGARGWMSMLFHADKLNELLEVAWRLLCEGTLRCEPIVRPVVSFDALLTEYPKIANEPESNVKLGVIF